MQAYPPDIMTAAEQALDRLLCNCAESCGGTAGVRAASISDIAAAIAAEREACADIAKQAADNCGSAAEGEDAETMMRWLAGEHCAHQIEAAIRARST